MLRLLIVASVLLSTSAVCAQEAPYEEMFALRSSFGFRGALETANARISADPQDGTAAGVRALVYGNAVDFLAMAPAEVRMAKREALARALELAPKSPWTRAAYGLIHLLDDASGAERELVTCIDEYPAFLECHNLYGDLLRKTQRAELAGAVYRRALEHWPADGELLVSYALFLQETGQVDQGLTVLKDLVRRQPRFPRGHWHLAVMLYESGGDRAIAMHETQRALELDPLIWNGKKLLETLNRAPDAQSER